MNNKRKQLYDNLIGTGRVSNAEIGTLDEFRKAIKDEQTARQFHKNLLGAGFTSDEIGSEDDFYNSISSDFDVQEKAQSSNEPYTHVYDKDMNLVGGTAYQAPEYSMSKASAGGVLPSLSEQVNANVAKEGGMKFGKPGFVQDEATALHPMSGTSLADRLSNPRILDENNNIRAVKEAEEEKEIDKTFVSKPMNTAKDVYDNYGARFTNTQRGIELGEELAAISKGIQDKYVKEYLSSDQYKDLAEKYQGEELSKQANDQFALMYGEAIEKELEPYQKAYNDELSLRYGSQMEGELNRINKEEAGVRLNELSASVDTELEAIEKRITDRTKAVRNDSWKPGMPSVRDDKGLAELRGQRTYLDGAKELIEESQKIINAANDAKDGTAVGGVLRGVRDKAFDIDTWTMGLSDLVGGMRLNNILEKVEKGDKLTPAEEMLFDASVNNMAINYYYQNDLGKGYMAGQITGESLPFMLEMIVNPISASGNAIAKRLLNAGLKKFAKKKSTQVGARLIGDATAALGMASTTGMPSIIGDTYRRMNENYNYGVDTEGNLYANKKADAMGMGEAFTRSFTTRAIENQSEMIFNAFKGVGGFMKGVQDVLPGGVNRFFDMLSHNKAADAYRWLKKSPVFRNYLTKDLRNATQIGGIFEEYAEEVYNNLANFAIGEMSWEDVTSLDKNIDTFLGLAPTQVMFGILGLGGAGAMRYQTRRTLEDLQATMNEQQRRELEGLLDMGIDAKETDVRGFIRGVMANQNYTVENKRDLIKAAYYVAKQKGIDELAEADVVEKVNAEYSLIDSMTDPSTGTYAEVNRLVTNPETGEREAQPGYVVGWIGEGDKRQPIFVADGMENTYENRMVLKPTEWEKESYQEMPAEQVKAVSEEMIREEAAQQAEQEAKYAPEVLNAQMPEGEFTMGGQLFVPSQVTSDGVVYDIFDLNEKGKPTTTIPIESRPVAIDEYRDMLQAQLEAQEAVATPMSPMESQESTPMTPMSTPMTENVQPVAEGVATQPQATEPQAPVIPTKEDGSIDFVSYGKEGTFKTLGEKYGEKMPNKVAVTVKALAEDLKKAQNKLQKAEEAYDNAPIGREQKAEEARDKAKQELEAIQREANFWAEMDAEIKDAQTRRESILNPQAEVGTSTEPMNVDEFVAQQLASGNIILNKEDYKNETGYGDEEANAMNGGAIKLFGNNGMTIQEAGERLMEMDRENGTNFFDQSDPNAGRDALLSVLASVRSRKEFNQYIAENRKSQSAKESEGLRNELEKQVVSANYASLEDYVLQMEAAEMENPFDGIDVAQIDAIFAEAEEEYQQYLNSLENGQGTTSEAAEGRDNVLSEEQSDNTGGTSGIESEGKSERNGEGTSEASEGTYAEEVKEPLRNRAKDWENKLGVKVNLIESIDQVTNREALRAIQNGQRVTGWFEESTGEVCFYVPYLESENEVDSTYIHEVVAHKGLRGLLGDKFDAFCDEVWESMSVMDKAKYMAYPGVSSIKAETEEETIRRRRRAAADEYIAHLAENIDVTDSVWSQFTELIKKFLKAIGLEPKMTNADIANTIKKSYQRLLEGEVGASLVGEGTRFNAKKKRALETVSASRTKHHQTAISSADGAKILNNLDNLAEKYENDSYTKEKTFIGYLSDAIEAVRDGSNSRYATFETKNGKVVTIRLADHNATVSNFDYKGEEEGISIIVTSDENYGIINDGNAHIVEFYYNAMKLRRVDGKPLAEIVKSIKQSLYSGEYKDTTGLAERQEVNESRFRVVKDKNELVAVHNISEENLRKVLEVGGLIMPSIAITKADMGHEGYGEISLLFDKETINPSDRRNKVYGGDAWTPRFPSTTAKINDKVSSKVYKKIKELIDDRSLKDLYSLSAELHADNIERTISDRGVEGYYNKEWMKLAYLLDNGKKVKIPMKMKDYGDMSEKILEMVKEKGLKTYDIMDGGYEFYQNNTDIVEAVKRIEIENKLQSFPEEKRDALEKLLNEKGMTYSRFDSLISSARRMEYDLENGGLKKIIDRAALRESIEKKVKTNNADYNKWVDNLFDGIVEKYGIRNNRDWYTPSGNLRPWEQLYDNATPANILKHMLAENEQGGSGGFFDSNIMGASAETYDSIEEIREKGKKRLRKLEDGEYDEWSNSVAERMSEICNDFLSPSQRKEFGAAIDSKIDITNAVANDKTADGIYKAMKRKYPGFKKEHAKKVEEIVKEIQDFAIGYFEAKPRRIVPLSEVRKAIVPKKTSSDIVEGLKNNGIEVATYKNGDEAARARLIKKESNGIRFRVSNRNQEIFVSNAQRSVEGIKQEKATPQQWLAMIEKNGGLKAGEDKWLGLSDWLKGLDKNSVTKAEILDFIGENKIQIEEVHYIDRDDKHRIRESMSDEQYNEYIETTGLIDPMRLNYTTEGLENNHEIALVVPTVESWNENDEVHFGDAGEGRAIAWIRFGETIAYDEELNQKVKDLINDNKLGSDEWWARPLSDRAIVQTKISWAKKERESFKKRVLVIDEIQSKRHQEGRERGYMPIGIRNVQLRMQEIEERLEELGRIESASDYGLTDEQLDEQAALLAEERELVKSGTIPAAPFEKNWSELAFKRMLRYAAENGFDKVAWTTGAQQAERYSLSNIVDSVSISKSKKEDGKYHITSWDKETMPIGIASGNKTPEELKELFGKEIAQSLIEGVDNLEEGSDTFTLEGADLEVGGEGMKGFYDKMLPSFVNKYVKKWGTKVQDIELPNVEEAGRIMHSVDVTDTMKESVMEGQTMFRVVGEPAIDYVSQANDVVEVPRGEVMYTMNNIAPQLYKTSGRFMRQLYKYGTIGRVLKGEYAEIDQIKAKQEYDHAKPILEEYLNELVWMKYQATEAAQEVINDVISDVEYAMKYYKDLSLGKDVWRTNVSPRFRISDYGKQVKAEVDKVSSKYNGKEVMFFDSEMTDEEIGSIAPGYTAADLKPYFENGILGGYSDITDKISIFADNNPVYDIEDTIFHENLHSLLKKRPGITEAFAENALERFPKNVEFLKVKGYSDNEIPEELIVRLTAKAMANGIFDDVAYNLPESEFENLKELLKDFGYEYEQEIKSRALAEGRRGTPTLLGGEEIHETRGVRQDTGEQTEEKRTRKEQLGKLLDQVADMGLEGVLGNKEYTSAMVDIYKTLPNEVRAELADDALRNYGGSVSPAVSDYLNVKAEPSVWDKVVTIVREALRKVGFDIDLNANEVRYMVWRSKKPLDRNNLLEVAEDIDMKNRLKVGEYDGSPTPDGGGTRFRVSNKLKVRDEYEATIKKGGYQAREAVQDAMLSLRRFQELIEKATGEKIRDFENAWMHENRLSSVVQAKIHDMERKFYKPMMDAVKKLMKAANLEQEQVADYLMLKHGIERNREMAVRKALTDSEGKIDRTRLDQWYQDKEAIRNDASLDTWRKKQEAMDNAALMYGADMSRDYSGLTSMFDTDDIEECTNRAYDEVEALETAHPAETEALGKAIKAMTQNTLDESFGSGLMDRKVYNELSKDMYDYYIPLRGFEETTSDEVYAYLDQDRGAFNAPLKRAKGRSSKSDNPIAYLKSIAESGLMQGERNKMKQSFLNLVINHPSDLVSVREGVWVTYNPATGEWEVATPPTIPNDATPADVEAAMEAWEQQMEQAALKDPTLVKKVAEAADVPYRVVGNKMGQHQIIVKRLGKSYTLTINGNPRLAMALNGQTNPNNTSNDGKVAAFVNNKIGSINRSLAAWYTTRNPDFVASNFMRDTFYTNTIVRAKEGNKYANKFHKNYATVLPKMLGLFRKYENGTLNPADQTEAAFIDFMMNGGETGYSNLKDVEEIKKQITKALKESKLDKAVTAVGLKALRRENVEALAEKLDILNRAVENTARFAAFLTSREEGRSIAKSVFDAKEISVNFNKKGAGGTFFGMAGQIWFGNLAAMVGAGGRALYVFFNAAIQGSTNLMHVMKVNPKGTSAGLAAMFLMGAVVPFLFGDDDDEKDYYDLPEHVRRNHLIIPGAGDAWISIPLPIEYRIMYGIGELLTSWRTGHERGTDIARKMLSMTGQALPLNFLEEGLEAFVPSAISPIYQVMTNSSWTGLPIYKENDFNKDDPEYTKAYSNVDRNLLKFTKALYEWSFDEENQKERIDLNPAIIETLAKGYFGGLATQLSNLAKVGGMIAGEQEFDWRNIPIGNRILKTGDERTKEKRVNNEYFENMEKLDFLQSRERMLKKTEKGVAVPEADKFNAHKDLETMKGTEVYKKYQEFKKLKKKVDKIRKTMKEKGSTPEREKQLMEAQEAANKVVR